MNHPEDQFDDVTRLLGCKRYEQPPPGYFASFADKVIARIEREDTRSYSSWWTWFVDRFDAKPILVCAYGLIVSSLLFMGFRLSEVFEAELDAHPAASGPWLAVAPGSPLLSTQTFEDGFVPEASPRSLFARSASADTLFPASSWHFQPISISPVSQ